jgi:DNA-cytosine methyltransferase
MSHQMQELAYPIWIPRQRCFEDSQTGRYFAARRPRGGGTIGQKASLSRGSESREGEKVKTDVNLVALVPDAWDEILLVEDNSARAQRRRVIGVASSNGDTQVTVRLHRISAGGRKVLAERTYRVGALRERVKDGGKASVALEMIDGVRPRRGGTVVAAGSVFGCNAWFLAGLADRGLDCVVELRPSTPLRRSNQAAEDGVRATARDLLGAPRWKRFELPAPCAVAPLKYWAAPLADVWLPGGHVGRLFAAQTGGIPGVHRGTIFGLASDCSAELLDLLRVVGWARWIRPVTRREERRSFSWAPAERQVKADAERKLSSTPLTVRANITLARQQDTRATWNQGELSLYPSPLRGELQSLSPVLNVAELFAGAGGMGLGFLLAGGGPQRCRLVFSGEVNPIYVKTLRSNHDILSAQRGGDRADQVPEHIEPVDLRTADALALLRRSARQSGEVHILIGGPPCQGFSNANRNSWHSANPHNRLIDVFLRYVEDLRPPVFLLENVQGILWTPKGGRSAQLTVVEHLARRMVAAGYELFPKLLDAVWYGVPQYRSRFFLLGLRRDLGYRREDFGQWGPFPLPTHGPGGSCPCVTVRDAIADLPPVRNGEDAAEREYSEPSAEELRSNLFLELMRMGASRGVIFDHATSRHADYVIERYRHIPQGGNWQDIADKLTNYADVHRTHSNIYRRLKWREPSITIGHYRKSMLVHPSQHRGLSLREAARLQSFPDWFRFSGGANRGDGGLVHKQHQPRRFGRRPLRRLDSPAPRRRD